MKEIPEYPNYLITKNGTIFSRNFKRSGFPKEIKHYIHRQGYHRVELCNESKRRKFLVHRLVMLTFKGEPNGLQVNHKNGIKSDNRLSNLEYCTASYNVKHSFKLGLSIPLKGENNPTSILTKNQVIDIKKYLKCTVKYYGMLTVLSKKYGVSIQVINHIEKGNTWNHIVV
tara:strand:- start:863 stop:1375 length:513 start_codon:yes stop_codon:yes gene_type:complete